MYALARLGTGNVRATFDGVDVIDVRLQILGVLFRVLERNFVGYRVALGVDRVAFNHDHIRMNCDAGAIEVLNEFDDAAFVVELIAFVDALIVELNAHTAVEERQFLHAFVERIKVEFSLREDGRIRLEYRARTVPLRSAPFCTGPVATPRS